MNLFKSFWRKSIFLSSTALSWSLAFLEFTFIWNDYFWCLILAQSEATKPITLGLQTLQGQFMSSWNIVSAGSVIAALPPVIMFFTMQKHFIQGLTFGAVKG